MFLFASVCLQVNSSLLLLRAKEVCLCYRATRAAAGFVCERDDPCNLMAFKGEHERVLNQQCCLSNYDFSLAFLCKRACRELSKWPLNAFNIIYQTFEHIIHREIKRNIRITVGKFGSHNSKRKPWKIKQKRMEVFKSVPINP